jgi:hypothetical protein
MCVAGVTCDGDHTITGANGQTTDCTPYTCTPTGCQTTCHDLLDCVSPAVCNGEGQCVLAPGAQKVTASCAVARARGGGTGAGDRFGATWLAALALTSWLRRRRSSSRGGSATR